MDWVLPPQVSVKTTPHIYGQIKKSLLSNTLVDSESNKEARVESMYIVLSPGKITNALDLHIMFVLLNWH